MRTKWYRLISSIALAAVICAWAATGVAVAADEAYRCPRCGVVVPPGERHVEDYPSADLSVSALSKYVWRGFELSEDSMVLQPSMTVEYKGFSANLWGNLDTDPAEGLDNWNETDFTISYGTSMGMVGLGVGYIYYALDGLDDSQEIYASVGLDTILSPTVTVYREIYKIPGWYINAGVSHSIPLKGDIALDLGASVGFLLSDDEDGYADPSDPDDELRDIHDGLLSASVSIPYGEYITVTPELYYSFAIGDDSEDLIESLSFDGDDSDFLYGGVTVSFAF